MDELRENHANVKNGNDSNNYEILNTIDRLILFKSNSQIDHGIAEIQNYVESEVGK